MITVWRALRGKLAFFVIGGILGASIASVATPQKTTSEMQLEEIAIQSARNSEKISDLDLQVQHIYQWIGTVDIQKVHDAESMGEIRITVAEHEKLVWLGFGNLLGVLVLFGERLFLRREKKGA